MHFFKGVVEILLAKPGDANAASAGVRRAQEARKLLQRITDAGMRLFMARGYEATTLDAIAAEAGIARRTFFSYFKSKDDILMSLQSGMGDMIADALKEEPLLCKRPSRRHARCDREDQRALPARGDDHHRPIDALQRSSYGSSRRATSSTKKRCSPPCVNDGQIEARDRSAACRHGVNWRDTSFA